MSKTKYIPTSGIYPIGFKTAGIITNVKKQAVPDLSLVQSKLPCVASAVFTTNKFAAAPVILSKTILDRLDTVHSVVVNSGCANACTGEIGTRDALEMSKVVEKVSGLPGCLVMSTGVIGQHLNMGKITDGISKIVPILGDTHDHVPLLFIIVVIFSSWDNDYRYVS
jgi:glutamate N-acetyltransferase/amino-acid N-acetyltransferase